MPLSEVVTEYVGTRRELLRKEFRFFAIQRSAFDAISKAAMCELPSGKRHPHQRRLKRVTLLEAAAKLRKAEKRLGTAGSFEELHDAVAAEIGPVKGIGELTVYDIARRIGAFYKVEPNQVYLHRGTRVGAAALGFKGDVLGPKQLPEPFRSLTAAEVEDCLCVYKKELRALARKPEGQ